MGAAAREQFVCVMDEIEEFAYVEELREVHEELLRELDAWIAFEEELRALGLL